MFTDLCDGIMENVDIGGKMCDPQNMKSAR